MPTQQDALFLQSEGNQWYARNRRALEGFDPAVDLPLMLIRQFGLKPKRVVEIGASNGYRVAWLADAFGCTAVAVEPSAEAIADGKKRFAKVRYVQAVAAQVPLQETFDLVIVNFVFHWVDRASLLSSISEVDRLVEDGGCLVVGDFLPTTPTRVNYHHLPDQPVYTYKQNYAEIFQASGLYHVAGLLTSSTDSLVPDAEAEPGKRLGVWLLKKSLQGHYTAQVFRP